MIFDGLKFRRSRTVVTLPVKDAAGKWQPYADPERPYYALFGKVAPAHAKDAVCTHWIREGSTPLYAVPIPLKGHSLTNMAYGKDGKVYLVKDGQVYVSQLAKG